MFAKIHFDADGVPRSETFGDVYHSVHGGLAQSRHVFIHGNQLPTRWQDSSVSTFTVFETGFGLGLNFLATLGFWLEHRVHGAVPRLRFVSVEKFLPTAEDTQRVWDQTIQELTDQAMKHELQSIRTLLLNNWPKQCRGEYQVDLFEGQVRLHLYLGEVQQGINELMSIYQNQVDAVYLDGFSPAKNPAMWTQSLCDGVAQLVKPSGTLATWAVTGFVRRQLSSAGFQLEKKSGFASKREMLVGIKI